MQVKKRKPAMGAKSAEVTEVPSAKEMKSVPLSVKASLNAAKKRDSAGAKDSPQMGIKGAKDAPQMDFKGAKDAPQSEVKGVKSEYLKRLKERNRRK